MINIATIHHETSRFMVLQHKYLAQNTGEPFKVFCGISNASPTVEHFKVFDFSTVSYPHWARLDYLADRVCEVSNDDDLLVFMDSDAFPIKSWESEIKGYLEEYPIVAIVRRENPEKLLGEEDLGYPHPCFFATTVGFWKEANLSWRLDPPTRAESAGVVMHRELKKSEVEWKSLLRSNAINLHPLYFGIYGNLIYHHGAGNREVYDSIDIWNRPLLGNTVDLDLRYPAIPRFNTKLSKFVLDEIEKDDNFIRVFLGGIP
jgi:hypothetical protein